VSQKIKIILGARANQPFSFLIRSKGVSNYILAAAFPDTKSLV